MLTLTLVFAVLKPNSQVVGFGLELQVQGLGLDTQVLSLEAHVLGEYQVPRICVKDFCFFLLFSML